MRRVHFDIWPTAWNRQQRALADPTSEDEVVLKRACDDSMARARDYIPSIFKYGYDSGTYDKMREESHDMAAYYWYLLSLPEEVKICARTELGRLTQQSGCSLLHFATHQKTLLGMVPVEGYKGWLQMSRLFIKGITDRDIRAKTKKEAPLLLQSQIEDENMTQKARYDKTVEMAMKYEKWNGDRDCFFCCTKSHSNFGFSKIVREHFCEAFEKTCKTCGKQGHIEAGCRLIKAMNHRSRKMAMAK